MKERSAKGRGGHLPGIWTLLRDILTFVGGWVLTFMEVSRADIREPVLILCASLVVTPGAAVGAAAVADSISRYRGGTPDSQSESPSSASSPSV